MSVQMGIGRRPCEGVWVPEILASDFRIFWLLLDGDSGQLWHL